MKVFYHQKYGLVNRALKDNNESFSVGILTILMMMKQKGKSITDYNTDCRYFRDFDNSTATRFCIDIYDEDDGEPHFSEVMADWSREDYIRAIKIADKVKEMLLDVNMDIIQYPNDFMCGSGETFLDLLKKPSNDRKQKEDAERLITSTVSVNPETRTFNHIETLKEILESKKVELTSENIGVIELGKQTYREQKDLIAKQNVLDQRNKIMQGKDVIPDFLY